MSKKANKQIKSRKSRKNNRKGQSMEKIWLNQLEYFKNIRFGFGFTSMKLKNRTDLVKNKPNKKTKPKPSSSKNPKNNSKNNRILGFSF
jgi:hypothetical protein